MSVIKKTVSIDKNLVKEASLISYNFSSVVELALKEYIQHYRAQKAIESFGKWDERSVSSIEVVNKLRKADDRQYVKRNDKSSKGN